MLALLKATHSYLAIIDGDWQLHYQGQHAIIIIIISIIISIISIILCVTNISTISKLQFLKFSGLLVLGKCILLPVSRPLGVLLFYPIQYLGVTLNISHRKVSFQNGRQGFSSRKFEVFEGLNLKISQEEFQGSHIKFLKGSELNTSMECIIWVHQQTAKS